ncbi:MAG: hypothetical protein AABX03_03180 [Nanoarchaeota archaeon]
MTKKGVNSNKLPKNLTDEKIQKLLLENFIVLQKVMTDMSVKFDRLSDHISKLLNLFESSAKSFSDKQGAITKEDKDFLEKLDKLLEQNKTIAKSLTMMEERVRDKIPSNSPMQMQPQTMQNQGYQIPRYPPQQQNNQSQMRPSQFTSSQNDKLTQEIPDNPQNKKSKLLPRF